MKENIGKIINTIDKIIENVVLGFSTAGFFFMVGTTFYQVVARYVFNKPPTWSEETTLLVMIWVSLLTAGIGVRRGIHMKVELFLSTLPLLMRKVCEIAVLLVVGYYGYVMAKYSYILAIRLPNKLPATGISVVWMYMPASICGVLIIFSVAVKVLEYFLLSEKTRGARK